MHPISIMLDVLIVIAAMQVWAVGGYLILGFLEAFDTKESKILTCFFWPLIVVSWVHVKGNDYFKKKIGK